LGADYFQGCQAFAQKYDAEHNRQHREEIGVDGAANDLANPVATTPRTTLARIGVRLKSELSKPITPAAEAQPRR